MAKLIDPISGQILEQKSEQQKISIVVPVYCGSKTLVELIRRIQRVFSHALKAYDHEVILVDDNSPDNSFDVMTELSTSFEHVKSIKLSKNFGQQNATYCGMHYATGNIIVTMDDDLQHAPELLAKLINRLSSTTDLVYGVFTERHDGKHRSLGSKLTANFFWKRYKNLNGKRVSSFRVFRSALNDRVLGNQNGFVYISCLLLSKCNTIENVQIPYTPRGQGQSNYNMVKLVKLFLNLYKTYGPLNKEFKSWARLSARFTTRSSEKMNCSFIVQSTINLTCKN